MPRYLRPLVAVLCLTLIAGLLCSLPGQAQSGLRNPGFEEGFSDRDNSGGHVIVANGWEYWYQNGPDVEKGYNFRPTYRGENVSYLGGTRVHGGSQSQKMGTLYATHNAGLYQRVSVPQGSTVAFSAWAFCWSSNEEDTSSVSGPGNYRLYVGIDPTGGTNWQAASVRWSDPRIAYLQWVQLAISARAEADAVTVFLRGSCEYPVKHNESCWDDASLSVTAPTPRPTNTRLPTSTPTDTPFPTETPVPTATPTPILSSLCVQTFLDANGNGMRDASERALPGGVVRVLDAQQAKLAEVLTTGYDQPYCLESVAAGEYTLQARAPAGYQLAAPMDQTISVGAEPLTVGIACQLLPTRTPGPTSTPAVSARPTDLPVKPLATPQSSGLAAIGHSLYRVSGIFVIMVAVGLLLGLSVLRRR